MKLKHTLAASVILGTVAFPALATHEVNGILINRVYVDPTDVVVRTNTEKDVDPFSSIYREAM